MPSADDKRTAITLKVNLSCTLMAVALAFIGAAAGIATFVLDKRAHLLWFNVVFIGSIASLARFIREGAESGVWGDEIAPKMIVAA
jgi:hypothetical protein